MKTQTYLIFPNVWATFFYIIIRILKFSTYNSMRSWSGVTGVTEMMGMRNSCRRTDGLIRGPREPKKILEKLHYNTIYDWDVCGIFLQLYLSQYTAKMHRPSHFRRICVMKCHHLTKLGTEKVLQRFFVNMWSISPYHAKTAMTPWWDLFALQLQKTTNRQKYFLKAIEIYFRDCFLIIPCLATGVLPIIDFTRYSIDGIVF